MKPTKSKTETRITNNKYGIPLITIFMLATIYISQSHAVKNVEKNTTVKQFVNTKLTEFRKISKKTAKGRVNQLKQELQQVFSMAMFAQATIGKAWEKWSATQQKQYTEALKNFMFKKYLSNPEKVFAEHNLQVQKSWQSNDKTYVEGMLEHDDVEVVWRLQMFQSGKNWHVSDVVIDEMSMAEDYKFQFIDYLRKHTPEDLIKLLNDKIKKK